MHQLPTLKKVVSVILTTGILAGCADTLPDGTSPLGEELEVPGPPPVGPTVQFDLASSAILETSTPASLSV